MVFSRQRQVLTQQQFFLQQHEDNKQKTGLKMMFGLDAAKKKKLSKVAKDKAAAAAQQSAKQATPLQRSSSTRIPSSSARTSTSSSGGWESSPARSRGKVFEWIDDEGRSVSPPPPFARHQVREVSPHHPQTFMRCFRPLVSSLCTCLPVYLFLPLLLLWPLRAHAGERSKRDRGKSKNRVQESRYWGPRGDRRG